MIVKFIFIVMAAIVCTFAVVRYSDGHESNGFIHATEDICCIVETGRVIDGTLVWKIKNSDGTFKYLRVIFSHGKLHIKEVKNEN